MTKKEPALLTVLIETGRLRWSAAGIRLCGEALPLVQSEPGNLRPYIGAEFDVQVTFLRHRLSGVLQRGCDRLWGRTLKPCQIVFLADGLFAQAPPELTPRVAEHFVEWMTSPPVVFFVREGGFAQSGSLSLHCVAGELEDALRSPLETGMPALFAALDQPGVWEIIPPKSAAEVPKT